MKDYKAQVLKLRADAAEAEAIRDSATNPAKREIFDRLAQHLSTLADQVEQAMHSSIDCASGAPDPRPSRTEI